MTYTRIFLCNNRVNVMVSCHAVDHAPAKKPRLISYELLLFFFISDHHDVSFDHEATQTIDF